MNDFDVIVIGAGAAGMMCAAKAGQSNKKVLLLEKTNKVGKKILMSGGGRCNFTNLDIGFENYLSHNRHFFKSALSRYTQFDFIKLVESYDISYYEKTLGQLFCTDKSKVIVDMLVSECSKAKVKLKLKQEVAHIEYKNEEYTVRTTDTVFQSKSLVIATGGLSIPTLGSSPFGYQIAKQFGHHVLPTRAGLVPFTLHDSDKEKYVSLIGNSVLVDAWCQESPIFRENLLFTHRGLSGPAMLQLSSYWQPGQEIYMALRPDVNFELILNNSKNVPHQLKSILNQYLPKKLIPILFDESLLTQALKSLSSKQIQAVISKLSRWICKPNATEGYRTAEVTLGGVDCHEVCSKTFESKKQPGLFFIGEVLDVTGWLGGYNFQWAWSSAVACAEYC